MDFITKLNEAIKKNNSLVCVGLDSDYLKLPLTVRQSDTPQFAFNKAIVDATHDLVCAYKPNPAFYEARGDKGLHELRMTVDYIRGIYPNIPIIIDAKRGDIGNTNEGYARYVFEFLKADAMTVMPYMGIESLGAYFQYNNKGVIVGCHSSNPGAKEFQELEINGKPLYEVVAEEVVKRHGNNPNTMVFMGATYPEQLNRMREIVGEMTFLVPGIGVQGGDLQAFVKAGVNKDKRGLIINSSRGIIFASHGTDFAEVARKETLKLRDQINKNR